MPTGSATDNTRWMTLPCVGCGCRKFRTMEDGDRCAGCCRLLDERLREDARKPIEPIVAEMADRCPDCGWKASRPDLLKGHMMTHRGVAPKEKTRAAAAKKMLLKAHKLIHDALAEIGGIK